MTPLDQQVMVITGASSGIGRCTALTAAAGGAKVVLAARGTDALEAAAAEIVSEGGAALTVPMDVTDYAQVEALGQRAVDHFGRIDTWVNNAGVAIYAPFWETTPEEFAQLVAVNLMGEVYGSHVALRHMRERRGTIINVASVEAERGFPLHAAYSASKHAIRGFSEALRVELEHANLPIHITVIQPASIDTPLFQHALAKLPAGMRPRPLPPVYDPQLVADTIVYAATHRARNLTVGGAGAALEVSERMAPRVVDRALRWAGFAGQETAERPNGAAQDNLFSPAPDGGSVRGGWDGRGTSLFTWLVLHPGVRRAAAGGAVASAALLGGAWSRNRLP